MNDLIAWWLDTTVGPFTMADIAGFTTGALCVWLVTREHPANFPVGIANNIFFFILFTDVRLFADAGLQVVYLVLGVIGWYWWLRGGQGGTELQVSRANRTELWWCLGVFVVGWMILTQILYAADGAAPPIDAATTMAALVAQYLLNRKRLESWYVWIAVDVVSVPLYLWRDLPLTGLLYLGFIGLCLSGLAKWRRSLAEQTGDEPAPPTLSTFRGDRAKITQRSAGSAGVVDVGDGGGS